MSQVRHRVAGFLWPIPGRRVAMGVMWVIGIGRLGFFSIGAATRFSAQFYGLALVLLSLGLLLSERERALTWYGRGIAALGAGVLMGLGIDIGLQVAAPNTASVGLYWLSIVEGLLNTSSVILYWLSIVLIFEAGARREC